MTELSSNLAPGNCFKVATAIRTGKQARRVRAIRQSERQTVLRPGLLLPALLCVLMLAACAPERGLVSLEQTPYTAWHDDADFEGLQRAVESSIAYYEELPPQTRFRYGDVSYTPAEMADSLRLFLEQYREADGPRDLSRRIAARFHAFESLAEDGENLFTGYYEPELPAAEQPTAHLDTPLHALPRDLVKVNLRDFNLSGRTGTLVGRVEGGELRPYYSRKQIQAEGVLNKQAEVLAWVNRVDLFFLQIQGSGVLAFADGRRLKVGYAAGNGHRYRSIGAILVRREAIPREEVSLQSIRAYLTANPHEVDGLLYANPSYVFFSTREEGPFGNINVPLTPGRSLAVDSRLFPKGSLAYVDTVVPTKDADVTEPFRRFMLVQDTGGAIRGHGRGDLFWGAGPEAEWSAGHMKNTGRLLLLVARKEYLAQRSNGEPAPALEPKREG